MGGVVNAIGGVVKDLIGTVLPQPQAPQPPAPVAAPVLYQPPAPPSVENAAAVLTEKPADVGSSAGTTPADKPNEKPDKRTAEAQADPGVKAQERQDAAARRKKGRAATVLTGESGAGTPRSAVKTLLGE